MITARTLRSLLPGSRHRSPHRTRSWRGRSRWHRGSAETSAFVHAPPASRLPSHARSRQPTSRSLALFVVATLLSAVALATGATAATPLSSPQDSQPRVELRVLVLDDGGPAVGAIRSALAEAGTPFTVVDLTDPDRQPIDAAFLSGTDAADDDRPWAYYQGVVAPTETPAALDTDEVETLADYRARFDIPQVDAAARATPQVGLNRPQDRGYQGALDGVTATVTAAGGGQDGPFGYLDGALAFDDLDPRAVESRGALAAPPDALPRGESFTSLLAAPLPGSDAQGSLIGEYVHDGGLRDLVVTFDYDRHQQQFHLLSRGIVDWLTDGVRLGQGRYYFSVHIDDVLADNTRWSIEDNCTQGESGCPATDLTHPPIRMTADDAQYAAQWQQENGIYLDIAYNAGLGEEWRLENGGEDLLTDQMIADRAEFRWLNHTYDHNWLGCERDYSVDPWRCATTEDGQTRWASEELAFNEITRNLDWAAANDVTVDATELVTGEHGGLRVPESQPQDNPNLISALETTGVLWIAGDNSLETEQRQVGEALTVPRHPMDLYYNAGAQAEQVDLYNWIYTSASDGGSGACDAGNWCLPAPLDLETGFEDYVLPTEAGIAVDHVLRGDPRPHFVHQSNLAEDRLLYPVLNQVLATYDELFDENTPLINPSQREAGEAMSAGAAWEQALAEDRVTAYRIADTVTVSVEPANDGTAEGIVIPATAPEGTTALGKDGDTAPFATAYATGRSGWATPEGPDGTLTLQLPSDASR